MSDAAVPSLNPLLQRINLPGEVHRLPSNGLLYVDGELSSDVVNGEVEILPMNAYDEVTIRSPDLLFDGKAVERIITHCVPQVLKPSRLFAKDIDFLMAAIRRVSYGDIFEIKYKHDCPDAKEHKYSLSITPFLTSAKAIDPTTFATRFTVKLPNGQVVKLNPIRQETIVRLMQALNVENQFDTVEQRHQAFIDILRDVISSVDETNNIEQIVEWLNAIPIGWAKQINQAAEESADWGPEFNVSVKCKDCGQEVIVATSMNPLSFFIE